MTKKIIIVEPDNYFINSFKQKLIGQQMDKEYEISQIDPTAFGLDDEVNMVDKSLEKVRELITTTEVQCVFIDITFDDEKSDRLGVLLATKIKEEFLAIPTFCITNKTKSEVDYNNFCFATLEPIEGVFIKRFLTEIAKKDFKEIFLKAEKKIDLYYSGKPKILGGERGDEEVVPNCDYAIITALEEDEMESILPLIVKTGCVKNEKHLIEYGYLNDNPKKKIAYASQLATGMIDASILATEMIIRFKPKFLIMTGVLGGKPDDTKIGDIVVSTKVFTVDKGKITDDEFKKELESANVENAFTTSLRRKKQAIIDHVYALDERENRKKIDIHFAPIACVRQVIDKEGYFVENVTTIDRKTIGLEMESYGIARACELVCDGGTKVLITKSVMDNTQDKTDKSKKYASWTSAMFVHYILAHDLI